MNPMMQALGMGGPPAPPMPGMMPAGMMPSGNPVMASLEAALQIVQAALAAQSQPPPMPMPPMAGPPNAIAGMEGY